MSDYDFVNLNKNSYFNMYQTVIMKADDYREQRHIHFHVLSAKLFSVAFHNIKSVVSLNAYFVYNCHFWGL